jgi:hypothetical protein
MHELVRALAAGPYLRQSWVNVVRVVFLRASGNGRSRSRRCDR